MAAIRKCFALIRCINLQINFELRSLGDQDVALRNVENTINSSTTNETKVLHSDGTLGLITEEKQLCADEHVAFGVSISLRLQCLE